MAENDSSPKSLIKPALLVVDVQNHFLGTIPQRDRELAFYFINMLIALFRKYNFPVIRIYHQNEEMGPRPETEEFEYPRSIEIIPEDIQVIKNYSDSFNKTELDNILKGFGTNTVFICGLSAIGCVLATRNGARNHDFRTFIVKNAIMSHDSGFTRNVEIMFDAVSYDVVKLIVECAS